jgi:hypothetical protein
VARYDVRPNVIICTPILEFAIIRLALAHVIRLVLARILMHQKLPGIFHLLSDSDAWKPENANKDS